MSEKLKTKGERDTLKVLEILDTANPKRMTVNLALFHQHLKRMTHQMMIKYSYQQ